MPEMQNKIMGIIDFVSEIKRMRLNLFDSGNPRLIKAK